MDAFTRAYLICALWSSTDNSTPSGGEPLDKNYCIDDFSAEAIAATVTDCLRFQHEERVLLAEAYECHGYTPERAGHDFWLTRNRHGVGFWDRSELGPALGRALTNACRRTFKDVDLCVGDDGRIHT